MIIPNGWLVRMKQYLRKPYKLFDEYEDEFRKLTSRRTQFTAFGRFDRIEVVPINSFSDFRNKSATDKNWLGKRQSIILYGVDETKRVFGFQKDANGKNELTTQNSLSAALECRFFILTMLHVSGTAKTCFTNYDTFLKVVSDKILNIVKEYSNRKQNQEEILNCEVFGTFNSAEIAVLWAADQFVDVLFLLDELRHLQLEYVESDGNKQDETILLSTYTVISSNPLVKDDPKKPPKGNAVIQLECSPSAESFEKATRFVRECVNSAVAKARKRGDLLESDRDDNGILFSCTGEYDYMLTVPYPLIPYLFPFSLPVEEEDLMLTFSFHNPDFAKYLRQTTTCLCYSVSDLELSDNPISWEDLLTIDMEKTMVNKPEYINRSLVSPVDYLSSDGGKTFGIYNELLTTLKENMPYSAIWKTLEILYSDYAGVLCTAVDQLWIKDFSTQFNTALVILYSYLKGYKGEVEQDSGDASEAFTEGVANVCDILLDQVNHISESSKLFFEVPNSKLGYTAQFDLVLHSYYGAVKELIWEAYNSARQSWQYEVIPVINFVNTPKIASSMHYTTDGDPETPRLVSISLPYDSWANPLYYIPFLVHEVYHYIAPADRFFRNQVFVCVIIHRLCLDWVQRSATYFFAVRNGKDPDWLTEKEWDKLYSENVQKIVKCLNYSLFQNVCEKVAQFFKNESNPPLTAPELRDALIEWLKNEKNDQGKFVWA